MSFISDISDLMDYNWKNEQRSWEEENNYEFPENKPDDKDKHIFKTLVSLKKFLSKKHKVYNKEFTYAEIFDKLSADELEDTVERIGETLAQEGRL